MTTALTAATAQTVSRSSVPTVPPTSTAWDSDTGFSQSNVVQTTGAPFALLWPVNVVQCDWTLIEWVGGVPPFTLSIDTSSNNVDGSELFSGLQGHSVHWLVDLPAETTFTLNVADSKTSLAELNAVFLIAASNDTTCLSVGQPVHHQTMKPSSHSFNTPTSTPAIFAATMTSVSLSNQNNKPTISRITLPSRTSTVSASSSNIPSNSAATFNVPILVSSLQLTSLSSSLTTSIESPFQPESTTSSTNLPDSNRDSKNLRRQISIIVPVIVAVLFFILLLIYFIYRQRCFRRLTTNVYAQAGKRSIENLPSLTTDLEYRLPNLGYLLDPGDDHQHAKSTDALLSDRNHSQADIHQEKPPWVTLQRASMDPGVVMGAVQAHRPLTISARQTERGDVAELIERLNEMEAEFREGQVSPRATEPLPRHTSSHG